VRDLIKGLRRNDPIIITGSKSRFLFWAHRLMPPRLWYAFTDNTVAKALKGMKM
jgi:hypothetical protein